MKNRHGRFVKIAVTICAAIFVFGNFGAAEEKKDMQGWEKDSPYNKHYDVREYEKIKCWFLRAKEVIPMPGMSPATVVEVLEGAEVIEVHLCPTWYRKPSDIKLKKNARIKVKGVWAEINGRDVFMASKIKKDPNTDIIKVRLTKDGTPFWTMTPEQVAWETLSDGEKEARMAKGEGPPQTKSQ